MRNLSLAVAAALALTACSKEATQSPAIDSPAPVAAAATQAQPAVDLAELYAQATQALFQARPMNASLYRLDDEQVGLHYADRLEDFSPAAEKALRQKMRDVSSAIANWPKVAASEDEQLNRDIMTNVARYYAGNENFPVGYIDVWMGLSPFVVNQINGPLIDIPRSLEHGHKVDSEVDATDYLKRLAGFDAMVNSVLEKLQADVDSDWIAPPPVLQGALEYIDRFTAAAPADNALVTSFAEKLSLLPEISDSRRRQLVSEAEALLAGSVYPAFNKVSTAVAALLPLAPESDGIWAQPGGEKYYLDAIRFLGDSDLSADKIHQLGLDEIERISAQMDTLLQTAGYEDGSVGARMVALSKEPRFLYEDSAAGRLALLEYLNGEIETITERMQPWFTTAPPYEVEVRAYPEEIQEGMPGGEYQSPSVDGSKPGIYWINLRDMQGVPSFTLKTLTYHEANPGHHWQVALNLAQQDLPFLRRISPYNAYAEGWALYAEQVAAELGMYKDDPFGDLGRLQDELFRAVRLAVDTGLHHKRWSRQEAITFMSGVTGKAESEVVAEIDRYMAWPGQALGYKLGMLKIQELRGRAQAALGDRFDLAAFHDLLLLDGAMPMLVLERRVNSWISAQQG